MLDLAAEKARDHINVAGAGIGNRPLAARQASPSRSARRASNALYLIIVTGIAYHPLLSPHACPIACSTPAAVCRATARLNCAYRSASA